MGKVLSISQENAIFKAKPQAVGGDMSGPSWSSLAKKYGVSVGTVQRGWANANLRDKGKNKGGMIRKKKKK